MRSIFIMSFFLASCQTLKPTCSDTRKAAVIAGDKIGNVLSCKHPELIADALMGKIEGANLCEEREQGALQDAICRPVAAYVADLLVTKLPAQWECDGGSAKEATVNTLYSACVQGNVL